MAFQLAREMTSASNLAAFENRIETSPDGSVFVKAPAKVNIFLHVTGRRGDGYHLLESLFVFTKKGDLLRFKTSEVLSLEVSGPFADETPNDNSNLVLEAAALLRQTFQITEGAAIELEKNLPVASGIGGGSSDAAAALIGLSKLWGLNISKEQMHSLALCLGADVPSCLSASSAMVRGIGEDIVPVSLPWGAGIVLVNPGQAVSTASVFQRFKTFRSDNGLPLFDAPLSQPDLACESIAELKARTSNSLSDPARQLCDQIAEVEQILSENSHSDLIRMSGSGATVFALYPSLVAAQAVASRLRSIMPNWWIKADELRS